MDENGGMKKRHILMVFIGFTLAFLFLYKGIILSGDEYLDAYNEIVGNPNASKTSSLKKPKITDSNNVVADPEKKAEKIFFTDMNINL